MSVHRARASSALRLMAGGVLLAGTGAGAARTQERIATPTLACAEAFALVARAGAIVLTTGPGTYARLVRDGGFCPLPEAPRPAFEMTRDNPKCFVGYECRDKFNEGGYRD